MWVSIMWSLLLQRTMAALFYTFLLMVQTCLCLASHSKIQTHSCPAERSGEHPTPESPLCLLASMRHGDIFDSCRATKTTAVLDQGISFAHLVLRPAEQKLNCDVLESHGMEDENSSSMQDSGGSGPACVPQTDTETVVWKNRQLIPLVQQLS